MSRRTAALAGAVVLGAFAVAVVVAFRLDGGRWFVVATPSMGEQLPVGSLVLTSPSTVAETSPGDMVSFRAPGSETVYTHRAVRVGEQGLTTRGDINATADPWRVADEDLVGSVVWHAGGLGWLVRGLPLFFLGLAVVWALTTRLSAPRRYSWRLLGVSSSLAVTTWWLKPWVGLVRMNQTTPDDGSPGVLLDVVSTGVLPIRASEVGGPASASLVDGAVGTLHLTAGAETGAYDVVAALDLTPGWWVALVGFCLLPTAWTVLAGLLGLLPVRDEGVADVGGEPVGV